jgi:hypothetical protein
VSGKGFEGLLTGGMLRGYGRGTTGVLGARRAERLQRVRFGRGCQKCRCGDSWTGFQEVAEGMLRGCWDFAERVLAVCREGLLGKRDGGVLMGCWERAERVLRVC